jgi:hypothetical protein
MPQVVIVKNHTQEKIQPLPVKTRNRIICSWRHFEAQTLALSIVSSTNLTMFSRNMFVALVLLAMVASPTEASIHHKFASQHRLMLFNSRRLEGECCKYTMLLSYPSQANKSHFLPFCSPGCPAPFLVLSLHSAHLCARAPNCGASGPH